MKTQKPAEQFDMGSEHIGYRKWANMLVFIICITLAAIPIVGCSQQAPASPEGKLPVVTTNIILADFVKTMCFKLRKKYLILEK